MMLEGIQHHTFQHEGVLSSILAWGGRLSDWPGCLSPLTAPLQPRSRPRRSGTARGAMCSRGLRPSSAARGYAGLCALSSTGQHCWLSALGLAWLPLPLLEGQLHGPCRQFSALLARPSHCVGATPLPPLCTGQRRVPGYGPHRRPWAQGHLRLPGGQGWWLGLLGLRPLEGWHEASTASSSSRGGADSLASEGEVGVEPLSLPACPLPFIFHSHPPLAPVWG